MKKFFVRYYHLVLLGLTLLFALGSAIYLLPLYLGFKDSFSNSPSSKASSPPTHLSASTNSIAALDRLTNKILWQPRQDGASPLVSRPYLLKDGKLVDPMVGSEPLYPPVPNQWLIDHQLDYSDMNILQRDPTHKGFTVLDEFLAGTDPNNAEQFPPLYTKLSFSDADIKKRTYLMEFLGTETINGQLVYQLRPLLPLPDPERKGRLDTALRNVAMGETVPGAPFLKVVDYVDKKKIINDTEYDFSELILQNTLTGERHALTKKNISREYQKHPIQLVESVVFHYQLAGAPEENVPVDRGKEFTLGSLDKKHTETYKLVDFSNEGILLSKGEKKFVVKLSTPSPSPEASPSPPPH